LSSLGDSISAISRTSPTMASHLSDKRECSSLGEVSS
jgi:hypothetical protein